MFIKKTSLIIPTRERINNLNRLFYTIKNISNRFNEILIIDSSRIETSKKLKKIYSKYKNVRVIRSIPSTSKQRNVGIKKFNRKNNFLMFCDDDILFHKNSFKNMDKFINKHPKYVGYGFNLIERENKFFENIKKSKIFKYFGFYDNRPGIVCDNGWHTKICNISKDCRTMWLSTQACIYRTKYINKNKLFDIDLGRYSYLEDLFFSFAVGKFGTMGLSKNSKYKHPNNVERINIEFGIKEVINRYKFVKKNNLNVFKFYITISLKSLLLLSKVLFLRLNFIPKLVGNIIGIVRCLTRLKE